MESRRDFLKNAGMFAAGAAALTGISGLAACSSGQTGAAAEKPKYECDVLVAGAGIGGLAAGVSALETGAKTILVEVSKNVGGTSRFAAGGLGLRFGDEWEKVLQRAPLTNVEKGKFVCEQWKGFADWINELGLPTEAMSKTSPYLWMGGKRPAEQGGKGWTDEYLQKFGAIFDEKGGTKIMETRVVDLTTDEKGQVNGVVAENAEGTFTIKAKSVIIATGGWQRDKEMCTKYLGRYGAVSQAQCVPYLDGAGIKMAMKLGAKLSSGFGTYYGHPQPWPTNYFNNLDTPAGYETLDNIDPMNILFYGTTQNTFQNYGIYLNTHGKRFVNEQLLSYVVNQEIMQQPFCRAYLILDESCREYFRDVPYGKALIKGGDRIELMKQMGMTVFEADTLEDLATKIAAGTSGNADFNIPNMMQTISEYNEAAAAGTASLLDIPHSPDLTDPQSQKRAGATDAGATVSKTADAVPLVKGPFVAIPVVAGIMATFGGLEINNDAQVIGINEKPIPGLYAIPGAAGGIMEADYWCVMSGNSIYGKVAGQTATQYAQSLKA